MPATEHMERKPSLQSRCLSSLPTLHAAQDPVDTDPEGS